MSGSFLCGRFELNLERPLIMGIVNVTPDSFSDGAQHFEPEAAIAHARLLVEQGADMLDIGGESTRPGAEPLSVEDELQRVLPVIDGLRALDVPLSVDTFKPPVMRAVLDAGADMINDICGFTRPGAVDAVANSNCGLCIMHMQGEPKTMQSNPQYADVVGEVRQFLLERVASLKAAGIAGERVAVDPGFGFGKTAEQNYTLLRQLHNIDVDGCPWLIGVSRKSMIGHIIGRSPAERVHGSVAAALAAVARGARIIRVHDVAATSDAIRVWSAVESGAYL